VKVVLLCITEDESLLSLLTMATNQWNYEVIAKSFLAGGVAGMCSKTAVAPLDRIKILLQAHNKHYKSFGVLSGLKEIYVRESFLALYKGNGAQMVRIFPYAAIQFTSHEMYKKWFAVTLGPSSHIGRFLSGSCAGVTAVCMTYPLDTIRARLAFQVKTIKITPTSFNYIMYE